MLIAMLFLAAVAKLVTVSQLPVEPQELSACRLEAYGMQKWLVCPAQLWVSNNGGRSWSRSFAPEALQRKWPLDIGIPLRGRPSGTRRGWIASDGYILETTDGGKTWTDLYVLRLGGDDVTVPWVDVSDDHQSVLAIVEGAGVPGSPAKRIALSTRDGGITWLTRTISADSVVGLIDGGRFYIFGRSGILVSPDGGGTWRECQFRPPVLLSGVDGPDDVVAMHGQAWALYGATDVFVFDEQTSAWRGSHSSVTGPGPRRLTFRNAKEGVMLGADGLLRLSKDGGFSWQTVYLSGTKFVDVHCPFRGSCLAVNERGYLQVLTITEVDR